MSRFFEPSTWAGIAGALHAIAALVATGGADVTAWGTLAASLAAIALKEKGL